MSLALASAACGEDPVEPTGGTGAGSSVGGGGQGGGPPDLDPTSQNAALKLKAGTRFRNDVAESLGLPQDFCKELGFLECTGVHGIVMGGSDALFSGLYEPLPETTATSPLAFERVALSGCTARADLDFADPTNGLIFSDLPVNSAGALTAVDDPKVAEAIVRLYQRGLARNPNEYEQASLTAFYSTVSNGPTTRPARDWAALSCFAVLSSMENIFY